MNAVIFASTLRSLAISNKHSTSLRKSTILIGKDKIQLEETLERLMKQVV